MKGKQTKINNFKKLANALRVILTIIYWILIVGLLVATIGGIALNIIPTSVIDSFISTQVFSFSYSFDNITLAFDQATLTATTFKILFNSGILATGAVMLVVIYIMTQLRHLIKNVLLETPFSKDAVNSIKKLGIAVIIGSFIIKTAMSSMNVVVYQMLNVETLLGDYIHSTINFNFFDGATILIGAVIILLAGVFSYGTSLQEEVDATL